MVVRNNKVAELATYRNGIVAERLFVYVYAFLFNTFPVVGIHASKSIYNILCFEPMQNLHPGVSKTVKEWAQRSDYGA